MHIKNIHCMVEKLAECAKREVEKGIEQLNAEEMGEVTDMIKDLCEAEYYARIAKAMEKSEEEDEAEEKYIRKILKEENKDEYKRMREEYGEEEADRRFYDNYRYKSSGRFAPKGRGSYMPRRGYDEPPYYHMTPDMMREHDPEYWRDMDRRAGKLYYTEPVRMDGMKEMHDRKDGKSWEKRRGYMETKEAHKDNTPQDKQEKMKSLEAYAKELTEDVIDMVADATPEERNLLRQKMQVLIQKIPQ